MLKSPNCESLSPDWQLGLRLLCGCCAGGEYRKGKTHTKAASRKHNAKARKPQKKHGERSRKAARPEKFFLGKLYNHITGDF